MTVPEMQISIVRLVSQITDKDILKEILDFFKSNQIEEADWWDEISEEEKEMIRLGEEAVKNGDTFTNEEVMEVAKSILKRN